MTIEHHGSVRLRRAPDAEGDIRSDRRLWITADGVMVEDGDERAAWLLAGAGGLILDREARRYHLDVKGGKVVQNLPGRAPVPATPIAAPPPVKPRIEEIKRKKAAKRAVATKTTKPKKQAKK